MASMAPSEVWVTILEFLPEESLIQVRLVNKFMCAAATPALFRRGYLGRKPPRYNFNAKATGLLSTGLVKYIKELEISSTILLENSGDESEVNIKLLERILEGCGQRLEKLTLRPDYAWTLPKKKNDVIFMRRVYDILSAQPLRKVKMLHVHIGCADFTKDRDAEGHRLHSRDMLPVPEIENDAPAERIDPSPFPALEYFKFSPDTKMGSPKLHGEISHLVKGCTQQSLRTVELEISRSKVQYESIDESIPCPLPRADLPFLRRFQADGKRVSMRSSTPLATFISSLSSLEDLELRDFVLKSIDTNLGNVENWARVFEACIQLTKLEKYAFTGCKNDCLPWHYAMNRMPYYIEKVQQSGERHTGFNSFWRVECETLEKLRNVVEQRRMQRGLPVSWTSDEAAN